MFEKEKDQQLEQPFKVMHNYRTTSTQSSKMSRKRPIRKMSEERVGLNVKKHRKMTANIEVEGILEQQEIKAQARCAISQAAEEPSQKMSIENCEFWESELEKVIPLEFEEQELDMESPFELTSLKNINSVEDYVFGRFCSDL